MKNKIKHNRLLYFLYSILITGLLLYVGTNQAYAKTSYSIQLNTVREGDKKVTGYITVKGKKTNKKDKYKIRIKNSREEKTKTYSKKQSKDTIKVKFSIKFDKALTKGDSLKVKLQKKSDGKWKTKKIKTEEIKKKKNYTKIRNDCDDNDTLRILTSSDSPDGLYLSKMEFPNSTRKYYFLTYLYKGKDAKPYSLPKATEVKLARKSQYLKDYFALFDKYYSITKNKELSALTAIDHYCYNRGITYSLEKSRAVGYSYYDWSTPIVGVYKCGVCGDFTNLVCYFCYLVDVDCVYVGIESHNHAVPAVKYNNHWYYVEGTIMGEPYGRAHEENQKYLQLFKDCWWISKKNPKKDVEIESRVTSSGKIPKVNDLFSYSGPSELLNFCYNKWENALWYDYEKNVVVNNDNN